MNGWTLSRDCCPKSGQDLHWLSSSENKRLSQSCSNLHCDTKCRNSEIHSEKLWFESIEICTRSAQSGDAIRQSVRASWTQTSDQARVPTTGTIFFPFPFFLPLHFLSDLVFMLWIVCTLSTFPGMSSQVLLLSKTTNQIKLYQPDSTIYSTVRETSLSFAHFLDQNENVLKVVS